jgi:hypothetical protein
MLSHNKRFTQLCTRLTLISTDKGFKAFKERNLHCIKKIVIASLTGHFGCVSHSFIPFNISALQSFQPSMYWGCSPSRVPNASGTAGCAGGVV